MVIKNFGTVYLDGQPYFPGAESNGRVISFGDTVSEKAIPFVRWKDLWVAGKAVCTKCSWLDLDDAGFRYGRPVRIDGAVYLCRSLKVGAKGKDSNEWDDIMCDLGEDDSVWHWHGTLFWGQELSENLVSSSEVRGGCDPLYRASMASSARGINIGFRPVLEPMPPELHISDSLIGTSLQVFGNKGKTVYGVLKEVNDYDLILLEHGAKTPQEELEGWGIRTDDGHLIIDLGCIDYLAEDVI